MSNQKRPIISEGTLLPISMVLIIIVGVLRVESTSFKANANEKEIQSLKEKNEEMAQVIVEVRTSLAKIEGALGVKKENAQLEVQKIAQ